MSNAFDGSRTLAQAGAVVGAIMQIGDVTKLTAAEQAKANTILEEGLAKYQALGREAPPGNARAGRGDEAGRRLDAELVVGARQGVRHPGRVRDHREHRRGRSTSGRRCSTTPTP
jgi:hypothetical protein